MYLSTSQVLYKLYLSTDVIKYKDTAARLCFVVIVLYEQTNFELHGYFFTTFNGFRTWRRIATLKFLYSPTFIGQYALWMCARSPIFCAYTINDMTHMTWYDVNDLPINCYFITVYNICVLLQYFYACVISDWDRHTRNNYCEAGD